MKTTKAFILIFAVLLSLTGCKRKEAIDETIEWKEIEIISDYENLDAKYYEIFRGISLESFKDILQNKKNATVFISFPGCHNCQKVIETVAETANKEGKIIYYLDAVEMVATQESNNEILSLLGEAVRKDDSGEAKLYTPEILSIQNGVIKSYYIGSGLEKIAAVIEGKNVQEQ